jgi:hypothetical protein
MTSPWKQPVERGPTPPTGQPAKVRVINPPSCPHRCSLPAETRVDPPGFAARVVFRTSWGLDRSKAPRPSSHCDRPTALCPSNQTMTRPGGGCRFILAMPVVRTTWRAGEISAGRMAAANRRAGAVLQPGPVDWPAGWGTWGETRVGGPRYRRK